MPRHAERWMGCRQARGPRRSCGSVAVPRAGRGGGCHGIRNRSMYLIRTGLASCRPDASARGSPVSWPGRAPCGMAAAEGGAGTRSDASRPCRRIGRGARKRRCPLSVARMPGRGRSLSFAVIAAAARGNGRPREWPSTGRAGAGRRIQKRPGKAPAFNRISRAD